MSADNSPSEKGSGGLEPIPENEIHEYCRHPQHYPPMHLHIPQGMQYRHICPSCKAERVIRPVQVSL